LLLKKMLSREEKMTGSVSKKKIGNRLLLAVAGVILVLSGCYTGTYYSASQPAAAPDSRTQGSLAAQIYFYPREGQTKEQQGRDHYECYNWAVKETGFDPATSQIPADGRVRLVPMPPLGYDTATLAIAGAVLGAILGGRGNAAGGAIIGATGGAILGAASDSARLEAAQQQQDAYAAQDRARSARFTERELNFRRAMSACLEGRGYSVK
jgi:hypothetical protein